MTGKVTITFFAVDVIQKVYRVFDDAVTNVTVVSGNEKKGNLIVLIFREFVNFVFKGK